jgi:hypothetical protein
VEFDDGFVQTTTADESMYWWLVDPGWLAGATAIGSREVAGRPGIVLELSPDEADSVLPGANRSQCVVDAERGVVLRCDAALDDELLTVEEVVEVAFDEPREPALFDAV